MIGHERGPLNGAATWNALERILTNVPRLNDPECGPANAALFDPYSASTESIDEAEARHHRALSHCQRCRAIDGCRAFAATEKDHGQVIAGWSPIIHGKRPR